MDKFDVIDITNNLDDLDRDMVNWYNIPYRERMRSNDVCMKRYNCTVPELYNRLKSNILSKLDSKVDNSSNIVMEATANFYHIRDNYKEEYNDKLNQAKALEYQYPFIIIISPDIESKEELIDKFNSFNLLNDKYKLLSNQYSLNIWGYNVYNMYSILLGEFETKDVDKDDNNSLIESNTNILSEISNLGLCIESTIEAINNAALDRDIIKYNTLLVSMNNNIPDNISESIVRGIISANNILEFNYNIDESILPTVTPWFTPKEFIDNNYKFDSNLYKEYSSYYNAILNNTNINDNLLKLGWNPSVDINRKTIEYARERQAKYFNSIMILKLNIDTNDEYKYDNDINLYPVYIINTSSGIYIDSKFKPESYRGDINKVSCIFLDKESYNIFDDTNIKNNLYDNSLYEILSSKINYYKCSPDIDKILYSNYINLIYNAINDTSYTISDNIKIYVLDSIDTSINILTNKDNLYRYTRSLFSNYSDKDKESYANSLADILSPKAVLIKK
jgi:hypothetical protein